MLSTFFRYVLQRILLALGLAWAVSSAAHADTVTATSTNDPGACARMLVINHLNAWYPGIDLTQLDVIRNDPWYSWRYDDDHEILEAEGTVHNVLYKIAGEIVLPSLGPTAITGYLRMDVTTTGADDERTSVCQASPGKKKHKTGPTEGLYLHVERSDGAEIL